MHKTIENVVSRSSDLKIYPKSPYSYPLYTTQVSMISYDVSYYATELVLQKIFRKLTARSDRWGVAYQFVDDWRDAPLWRSKRIPNPPNRFLADPLAGRNGGLIIENEEVFRIYQKQGFDRYGEALGVAKIGQIDDDQYCEEKLFEIEPYFFNGIEGTHTYSYSSGLLDLDFVEMDKHKRRKYKHFFE